MSDHASDLGGEKSAGAVTYEQAIDVLNHDWANLTSSLAFAAPEMVNVHLNRFMENVLDLIDQIFDVDASGRSHK